MNVVLAIDLGASSGRAMLCFYEDGRFRLQEAHRFENIPITRDGRLMWDYKTLLREVKTGMKKASGVTHIDSVGIDTWGVDFALVTKDGEILEGPAHYRDTRKNGISEEVFKDVPPEFIYRRTGIQFMEINTLYQLYALKRDRPELFGQDLRLLMMPDLLGWSLTGKFCAEISIASTSNLVDPYFKQWDNGLTDKLGLGPIIPWFQNIVHPGTELGAVKPEILEELGLPDMRVISVAGHDTASAVAAVPYNPENTLFLSSGTWNLIGAELDGPVRSAESAAANVSNEIGYGGKIRFLKNVTGFWLVQQARETFRAQGKSLDYAALESLALESAALRHFIDPDNPDVASPCDMPAQIRACCRRTNQSVPESDAALMRCIYDSLALKLRMAAESLETNSGKTFGAIHLVGGGTQSALLCQTIADITRKRVDSGPVEATALGNAAAQFIANGTLKDIGEARRVIRESFDIKQYNPAIPHETAEIAYTRFKALII
ncbi:MAG: rhamnulokinase [Defluviitaleaceae bacterium]|nr:rhamnulokinase [Defluviitaleaceae bacterium]MCL2835206.1 rhamnulokinase [Defluviitaleaceae bacterium]